MNPKPLELVDIVISIYNQERLIERVLGGVFRCTTTPFNLVLVFDGCTDRTKEVALSFIEQEKPALLRGLRTTDAPNVFETRANNIGFRLATSDYLLTVQDDVVIEEKGWERRMTWPLRRWDDVFAVTGRAAMNVRVGADGAVRYDDMVAAELFNLPRGKFLLRSAINRGPVALRADILRKLNFLDEAFAPAQFDEADVALRAYGQFGMKSGALRVEWRSDAAWGKTRGTDSTMNTGKSFARNAALLRDRHPAFASGAAGVTESRPCPDGAIDWRGRDPWAKRLIRRIGADARAAMTLAARKRHALSVRIRGILGK